MNEFISDYWFVIAWFIAIVLILAFSHGAATLRDAKDRRINDRRVFMHDYKKDPH